ncbi:hypothetical protein JQS43_13735 [Natronosporangium hydrolyticum]|uniref:Hydroxyurea phosphotransferase n=1 Tax=Natronosporangium hydrolyticum TaxID=2811111 RepID=A0A895YBB0_9ACTN|nr:hypothetical protein JQS43_13735 [Natronosporangium hydrolyticum]
MRPRYRVVVPEPLRRAQASYHGEAGRAWVAGLPALAESYLERWQLRLDGAPRCGDCALVLPVISPAHGPAVLKLQAVDDETRGEPLALQTWRADGAVRLLRHDHTSGAMLLERLDAE